MSVWRWVNRADFDVENIVMIRDSKEIHFYFKPFLYKFLLLCVLRKLSHVLFICVHTAHWSFDPECGLLWSGAV